MTVRLYFEDAYLKEFEAVIVRRETREGKPVVFLDRTAFYPESGGQSADRGTLNGVKVLDVQEDGEDIVHALESEIGVEKVKGVIDWPLRFDRMQQHSGQHVLSEAFLAAVRGETRSFHLGEDVSTLEIGLPGISEEELERVEKAANAVVFEDREVKTYFVPPERVAEVPLRRPPKKEGTLRIVEVSGYDYSACGGTHVRRTGEIGLIKVTRWEKIRGNSRFDFLCGGRALADYAAKNRTSRHLTGSFSVTDKDIPAAVEKLQAELKAQKKSAKAMQEALAGYEAHEIVEKNPGKVIRLVFKDKSPEAVRFLALKVIRHAPRVALFAALAHPQSHIILARSEELSVDLREFAPLVSEMVSGKGGGGPSLVEIVTPDESRLEEALEAVAKAVQAENLAS
jgi:alanyl-tRNA synthetase